MSRSSHSKPRPAKPGTPRRPLPPCRPRATWLLPVVLAAAVVVFKFALSACQRSPVYMDEIVYGDIAARMAYDHSFTMRFPLMFHGYPPLYSAALAPAFLAFQRLGMPAVYQGILLTNNLLGLLAAAAAWGVARRFVAPRAAWSIACLTLLWPTFSVYQCTILSENLFIPLYLVSVWLIVEITSRPAGARQGLPFAAALGFLLALLYQTRNLGGLVVLPAVAAVLVWQRRGRELVWAAVGLAFGVVVVFTPEYLSGELELTRYTPQQPQMIEALHNVLTSSAWFGRFVLRSGLALAYGFVGTFVVGTVAAGAAWRRMPGPWRAACLYAGLGFLFTLPFSVLLTCAEMPETINFIARYSDPFVTAAAVLGLVALPQADRRTVRLTAGPAIVALGLLVVPWLKFNFWMQVLPLNYLRAVAVSHRLLAPAVWFAVGGLALAAAWLAERQREAALLLAAAALATICLVNALHYRASGAHLRSVTDRILPGLRSVSQTSIDDLATGFSGTHVRLILSGMVYFWTLDRPDFKIDFGADGTPQ